MSFSIVLGAYVALSAAVLLLNVKWYWKVVLAAAAVAVSMKFYILRWLGGAFFAPEVPGWIILISGWMFAALMCFFCLLIVADIIWIIISFIALIRHKYDFKWMRRKQNICNLVLLIVAAVIAAVGVAGGTATPRINRVELVFPNLPPELDNFTIAVMADLHVDRMTGKEKIQKWVDICNQLNPDMITVAGDFVDGSIDMYKDDIAPLANLKAKYGVFGVSGNHEYYSGYQEWKNYLNSIGVKMLDNTNTDFPELKLSIAGVADKAAVHRGMEGVNFDAALANTPEDNFIILLAHRPELAYEAAKKNVDLQISGHTHGGMIVGFDKIVARFNRGFSSGIYQVGNMTLCLSNGTGIWNGFPIRIGFPAEIVLITLKQS